MDTGPVSAVDGVVVVTTTGPVVGVVVVAVVVAIDGVDRAVVVLPRMTYCFAN